MKQDDKRRVPVPRRLRIAGHVFKVRLMGTEEMDAPQLGDKRSNAAIGRHYVHYGSMLPGEQEIHLNRDIDSRSALVETLTHEILHACVEFAGLRRLFVQPRGGTKGDTEELFVQALGNILTQCLMDSRSLRRMYGKTD